MSVMFQSVRRVFESVGTTLHTLASHGEAGDNLWESEQDLYKRDIMICASQLGQGVDIDVKMEAIRKLGHLAYTGGANATKYAGTYLPTFAEMLNNRNTSTVLKIEVVKAISQLCRAHRDNCDKAHEELELIPVLGRFVVGYGDSSMSRWCCYALVVLCSSGTKFVRALMDFSDSTESRTSSVGGELRESLEEMETASWKGWPRNYAAVLRDMLGHVTVDLSSAK